MPKSFNFQNAPGYLIRRAQQLAVAIFMEETAGFDVTPVQFAILNALMDDPGELVRLLRVGAGKAREVASATLDRAHRSIGLLPA